MVEPSGHMVETNTSILCGFSSAVVLTVIILKAAGFPGVGVGTGGKAPKPFIPGKNQLNRLTVAYLYDEVQDFATVHVPEVQCFHLLFY